VRIVFYGTPEFAANSLNKITHAGFEVVGVVTAPDKPAGRGQKLQSSAVKIAAHKLGLPVSQPTNLKSEEFARQLQEWNPDLGVVIAFRMMPEKVWNFPPLGTVNLHASLLPDYRGAAPIQHAIINGESITGVSTFFLKHEIDTGDIIDQASIEITSDMNAGVLHDLLMEKGSELMVQTLKKIAHFGKDTPTIPQINKGISSKIAPKITRETCKISLQMNSKEALNTIRGLSPYPGAWIESQWGDMKIFQAELIEVTDSIELGLNVLGKSLVIVFKEGALNVLTLQLSGKSKMSSIDFLNGFAKKS
jgi:methionyl-tRNA formyltransferase